MKNKALQTIEKYEMLSDGDSVTVALSGGADSVALLHFLCAERQRWNIRLSACHINHQLRGEESLRDEGFVRQLCEKMEVPLTVFRENIADGAKSAGESVEQFGRRIRYERLAQVGKDGKIATAHTLSDRAETTFINLLRGTGLKGLCGIPPVVGNIIRPLIQCTREEIESYCAENALPYMQDSTNFSVQYTRNQIRLGVLPALREMQPGFFAVYQRTLSHLEEDSDFLEETAKKAYEQADTGDGLDVCQLQKLHPAIFFRVIKAFFVSHGLPFDTIHVQLAREMISCQTGPMEVTGGTFLRVQNGRMTVYRKPLPLRMDPLEVSVGLLPQNPLAGGRLWLLNYEQFTNLRKQDRNILKKAIDYDKIYGRLFLRQKKEGDYLRLSYRHVGKPLRIWWNEQKVPPEKREQIPVLADELSLVWVPDLGVDERVQPTENTKHVLVVDIEEEKEQ